MNGSATDGAVDRPGRVRRHYPGLEALRAVAVVVVVMFHAGLSSAPGGFLGVSLFFTISGFLVASQLLGRSRSGLSVGIGEFYRARARRLLPASFFTLGAITAACVMSPSLGRQVGYVGKDALASLAGVANWRFVSTGSEYSDLFRSPSVVLHFWSLAVEEQTYLVLGILVAAVALVPRSRSTAFVLGTVCAGLAVVSWLMPLVFDLSVSRTYYGTDTRFGEIAIGVVLACWCNRRAEPTSALDRWPQAQQFHLATVATLVALTAFGLLVSRMQPGSPTISRGLLPLVAFNSVALVTLSLQPKSILERLGATRLVSTIGRLSYVIYLVHWPIIVLLRARNVNLVGWALIGFVVVVVTLALIITNFVEPPFRTRRAKAIWVAFGIAAPVLLVSGSLTWWSPATPPTDRVFQNLENAVDQFGIDPSRDTTDSGPIGTTPSQLDQTGTTEESAPTATPTATPTGTDSPDPTASSALTRPLLVRAFGDSILLSLAIASAGSPEIAFQQAPGDFELGCGLINFVSGGLLRDCPDRGAKWAANSSDVLADVAIIMSCQWETIERIPIGTTTPSHLGESDFDAYVTEHYEQILSQVLDTGISAVVWVRCPHFSRLNGTDGLSRELIESRDPSRIDTLNTIIDHVVAQQPDRACTFPFDQWMQAHTDDPDMRPDGSHFNDHASTAGNAFAEGVASAARSCSNP